MDALEIKINNNESSFKYTDSIYKKKVSIQDVFYREIKPGDFVIMVFDYSKDVWHPNSVIDLFLISDKGILIYDEKSNKFKQESVCFMSISYQCTNLLVYKLEHSLPSLDLLKQSKDKTYFVEDSDAFSMKEVLSRHKEAQNIKAGDLIYTFSSRFLEKEIEYRYGICTGSSDYFMFDDCLNYLYETKNFIEVPYKVLNPTDEENDIKRRLTAEYLKMFETRVKYLVRNRFEPGDVVCGYHKFSIYLFDCVRPNRTTHICLSLIYCNEENSTCERLASNILSGKVTEEVYEQLIEKYYVKLEPLYLDFLKSNYIGSYKTGITASVVDKAIKRYKIFDRKYKHIGRGYIEYGEQYKNPINNNWIF